MVVVGAEASITPLAFAGFCAMKALSPIMIIRLKLPAL